MNSIPEISLLLSGNRSHLWEGICHDLGDNNKIPFEIVFVGPGVANLSLPSYVNTKVIQSEASPAQCMELSFRNSSGKYVLCVADDLKFCKGYLDNLHAYTSQYNMDQTVIIPRLSLNNKWTAKVMCDYHGSNRKWPLVGMHNLIKREIWHDLGGLDKRFIATTYNNDLTLRFYEKGGKGILADGKTCLSNEQRFANNNSRITAAIGPKDWELLQKLWHPGGKFVLKRQLPVESYSDAELLEEKPWR